MSTETDAGVSVSGANVPFRPLAMASALALTGSYVSVLYHVTDVVGGVDSLLLILAATFVTSTVLARLLGLRTALLVGVVALVAGLASYLMTVPNAEITETTVGLLFDDLLALLTGLSVLRMTKVTVWALAVAPGPVFLSWYLTLRRRYALATLVGGLMLGFFVLTGDAGPVVTLVGIVGAAGTVGFGAMERRGGTWAQLDALAIVLVAMVVLSMTVSVVPNGAGAPAFSSTGGGSTSTAESNLVTTNERVDIVGTIKLSPKVRFTVTADRPSYWRTAAYDRYTGGGWIRTGNSREYTGPLAAPAGPSDGLRQTVTAKTRLEAMPAAWRPVQVGSGVSDRTRVTDMGDLRVNGAIRKNESYTVRSRVPQVPPEQLRDTGTDYPAPVRERYLAVPDSTPDRVKSHADNVTSGADNPYDAAVAVERWLEDNKRYSLEVERPDGNSADQFLFEMDRGYCVHYATSMAVMLRTQGIPTRFVTGYTAGQRVAEDEWVVRGQNSHAWVEVYFEGVGWVPFDPTPAGPRSAVEQSSLDQARAADVAGVDTNGSDGGEWTPEPTETETETETSSETENATTEEGLLVEQLRTPEAGPTGTPNESLATPGDDGRFEWNAPDMPSREQLLFGLVVLLGVLAAAHRTGTLERGYRAVWLRWQPAGDLPNRDAVRAFRRLEYALDGQFRERRPGETPREYLAALENVGLDERAHRVRVLYERARYAGGVNRAEADEAISIVDDIVRREATLSGRFRERFRTDGSESPDSV